MIKDFILNLIEMTIISFVFYGCAKGIANKTAPFPLKLVCKFVLFAIFAVLGIGIIAFPVVAYLYLTSAEYLWAGFFALEAILMIIATYYLYLKVQKYKKEAC